MNNRKYVDIHCHPSTKPFLKLSSGLTRKAISLWDTIKYHLALPFIDEWIAKDALDSQSSLQQMNTDQSAYALVINPVTQMEQQMAKYTPMWLAVFLALPFPKQITNKYFKQLQSNQYPFFEKTKEELAFSSKTTNLNVLTNENKKLSTAELNLLLAIEGGHNLYSNSQYQDSDAQIIANLRELREQFRIFYLTLTHLTPAPLANHAFAMKLIGKKKIHHFYPTKQVGISDTGWKVIQECSSAEHTTFIDIKHMSLASRLQCYSTMRQQNPKLPLLATHCAATGYSLQEWKQNAKEVEQEIQKTAFEDYHLLSIPVARKNGIQLRNIQTKFNPSSINLYDDDIEAIVESGGLIGVSFDERILGRGTKNKVLEIMAEPEFDFIVDHEVNVEQVNSSEFERRVEYYNINMKQKTLQPNDLSKDKLKVQNTFKQQTADALYFLNNLLYMVQIAGRYCEQEGIDKDPWSFFALGSDFDGLIDAIDCCKTGKEMAKFEELLVQLLAEFIVSTNSYDLYYISRENTLQSVESRINDLCKNNAYQFIKTYL